MQIKQIYKKKDVMVNKNHKDRLFRKILEDEKNRAELLELYNALNGTAYKNPADLEITTIEDVLYMGMKNDISFLLDSTMSLYEHQSTFNPNMPLRGIMYFSKLYNKYITVNKLNIFSSRLIKIPMPQYYVFYNGEKECPDRMELKLSDAFENKKKHKAEKIPDAGFSENNDKFQLNKNEGFEWTAVMLNINYGKNKILMEKCKILRDYAILVDKIRKYHKEYADIETGINRAVNECIQEGVLTDFLSAHKSEVIEMCLTEYNEEETMELFKKEFWEDGLKEGEKLGRKKELINLIKDGILSKEQVAERLHISVEQLEQEM